MTLAAGVCAGDPRSVARALNLAEDGRAESRASIDALLQELPRDRGYRIGLTGAPGVGKSTLAGALAASFRRRDRTVAVVAVDPSSARSGGSLLGDRARMNVAPDDDGFFVRSLATEGRRGGLSWATHAAARILGAGFDVVLIETTGVGQSETDVQMLADIVVLVVQPGGGDALQFLKAGIMEIPDVVVVNKADREDLAEATRSDLRAALHARGRDIEVLTTRATEGVGVDALAESLESRPRDLARRRRGDVQWTLELFRHRHGEHGVETLGGTAAVREWIAASIEQAPPTRLCAQLSARYLNPETHA